MTWAIITLLIIGISILGWRYYILQKAFHGLQFTQIIIGQRINFTKDDEANLSQAKEPLKLLIKLCDQLISGYASNLSLPSTKDIEMRLLQGKIDGMIEIRGRLETMHKKKTDE